MIFSIYLIIGFLLDLYIENILNIIPPDLLNTITSGYDIDINDMSTRFIMLIICMLGWPFILIKFFNER